MRQLLNTGRQTFLLPGLETLKKKKQQRQAEFFEPLFSFLYSSPASQLPTSTAIKPLEHTNREMDTAVAIVLSHNDTSIVTVGVREGAHRHKYCHQPIFL